MSNATSPATADHAAEYANADDNIRSLKTARAHLTDALDALGSVSDAAEIRSHVRRQIDAVDESIAGETARRDAAELAQRAAAPASLFPSPERLAWERNR